MANEIEKLIDIIRDDSKIINNIHSARVSRIDKDGSVWVFINGSDRETPTTSSSSEVKKGDVVNVEWRNNKLYIKGNYSDPSAGSNRVSAAESAANHAVLDARRANTAAAAAELSADAAQASADAAQSSASSAATAAANAWERAGDAAQAAAAADAKAVEAGTAATTAGTAAHGALNSLSTVQDVLGVLNWAKDNAQYSKTQDTAIEPGKVYWTRSGSGTAADPFVYTPVVSPVVSDLANYYEISGVDEAMGDFINSHLALDSEGLWVFPAKTGTNKVLIATGAGSTYTTAGTYIISKVNNVDTVLAQFTSAGAVIGDALGAHSTIDEDSMDIYLDDNDDAYFHAGLLKKPTDVYYQSSNKVLGSEIRNNPNGGTPGWFGQWYAAWVYQSYPKTCPININLDIKYTGTAPTTRIFWIDGDVEADKDDDLYGTADIISQYGDKLGWSTKAKCQNAVNAFLANYDYPDDYLQTINYGAGYGQMTTDIGGVTYTYWTYNKKSGRDWNPDYDVQACIDYSGRDTVGGKSYSFLVGGYINNDNGNVSSYFLTSSRCKSVTVNYKYATGDAIASFFTGSGIAPTNKDQFVIGSYNDVSTDDVAFVIGNGKSDSKRSNCFAVSRDGTTRSVGDYIGNNFYATGQISDSAGNVLANKADASSVPTKTSQLTNDSGFVSDDGGYIREDDDGDVSITRNITAGGKATFGAINFNQLIQYTNVSATTASVAGNASGEATSAVSTLTDYYPIAITNVRVNTGAASLRRFYFATQQSGRASVTFGAQNDGSSAKAMTCQADILWIKIKA